jgi:hypothetical protein
MYYSATAILDSNLETVNMVKVDARILEEVEDYLKTSKVPVRRSKIASDINEQRKKVGSALYRLQRQKKASKNSDDYWSSTRSSTKNSLETLPMFSLPGYFISPWGLQPKEHETLIINRKQILIAHINAWVSNNRGWLRQFHPEVHKIFRDNFRTTLRTRRMKSALAGFSEAYNAHNDPQNFITGPTWIISDPKYLENAEFTLENNETIGTFPALPNNTVLGSSRQLTFGEDSSWVINSQPELWLGQTSIEGLRLLQNLTPAVTNSIKLSLVKVIREIHPNKKYDLNADVTSRIDPVVSELPIRILQTHTATQALISIISRLERSGVLKLGALRLLSESCVESFCSLEQDYWPSVSDLLRSKSTA